MSRLLITWLLVMACQEFHGLKSNQITVVGILDTLSHLAESKLSQQPQDFTYQETDNPPRKETRGA